MSSLEPHSGSLDLYTYICIYIEFTRLIYIYLYIYRVHSTYIHTYVYISSEGVRECQTGKVLTPDTYTKEEDKVIIAVDIDKMFDEMRDQC